MTLTFGIFKTVHTINLSVSASVHSRRVEPLTKQYDPELERSRIYLAVIVLMIACFECYMWLQEVQL